MAKKDENDPGSVILASISAAPIVAPSAAELLSLAIAPPLDKRRDRWLESLATRLKKCEVRLESLGEDPAVVSTILYATQAALRTHQEEKLEALRNAVSNYGPPKIPG
jgi:hypothetical protein